MLHVNTTLNVRLLTSIYLNVPTCVHNGGCQEGNKFFSVCWDRLDGLLLQTSPATENIGYRFHGHSPQTSRGIVQQVACEKDNCYLGFSRILFCLLFSVHTS